MTLSDHIREIIGQETDPPLWIWVTKDQIPLLEQVASELDGALEKQKQAFVDGVVALARLNEGRGKEFRNLCRKYFPLTEGP